MSPERRAWAVFWNHKRFWFVQTLAVTLWVAVAVGWFWLPDSKTWSVAMSAIGALPVIVGAVWLIAAAFVFYRSAHAGEDVRLRAAYGEALRRTPALFVWAAILAIALWFALRPPAPRWIWIAVPLLLAPLAAQVTLEGLRGLFRMAWKARYFAQFAVLAILGILLPYALIAWRPPLSGLALETTSLAVRFLIAYALAIMAWLALASLLAAGPVPSTSKP